MDPQLYLASASPRRKQLLEQLGLRCAVVPADVDESLRPDEDPQAYVLRLARLKAATAAAGLGSPRVPVMGADTAVVLEGAVLGKPHTQAEGLVMLAQLSGRRHQVLSAVAVWSGGRLESAFSESRVSFRSIPAEEARAYWASGEPADKAGGYAIQGRGAVFVERLEGSYSGVMGLPLFETADLLQRAGVHIV